MLRKDTLDQFEKWLGNNSISRVMIGSLKDESGVESDLNLIDSMLTYRDKAIVRNPSITDENTIFQ